jgi:hypothetical protein
VLFQLSFQGNCNCGILLRSLPLASSAISARFALLQFAFGHLRGGVPRCEFSSLLAEIAIEVDYHRCCDHHQNGENRHD